MLVTGRRRGSIGGESVLDAAYAIQPMSEPVSSHHAPPAFGEPKEPQAPPAFGEAAEPALTHRAPPAPGDATEPAPTYEAACARIEEIIRRLDSGEAGLRETLELCQEGRRLVEFCASELEAVGRGLEELRLDELVARLESGRAHAPAA